MTKNRWWWIAILAVVRRRAGRGGMRRRRRRAATPAPAATRAAARGRPSSPPARRWPASRTRARSSSAPSSTSRCFGLKNPTNDEVEGFDVEIAKLDRRGHLRHATSRARSSSSRRRRRSARPSIAGRHASTSSSRRTRSTTTRKQQVDFAGPYYVAGQDIMVKADDDSITGVDDLNGKKVCSVQGSTSLDNVREQAPAGRPLDHLRHLLAVRRGARATAASTRSRTDNVILLGLVNDVRRRLQARRQPVHRGALRHRRQEGRHRLPQLHQRPARGDLRRRRAGPTPSSARSGRSGEETPEPPPVDRY